MHVNGSIKRELLSRNETEEDFYKKQLKIKRMIGMSPVEFVKIPDVGSFSRRQVEVMRKDQEYKNVFRQAVDFTTGLLVKCLTAPNRTRMMQSRTPDELSLYNNEGIPKNWDGKDWLQYKWIMKNLFEEQDLWMHVNGSIKRESLSRNETEEDFDKKQLKIKRMIGMSVPSKILKQISTAATGAAMWEALCEVYEGKKNAVMRTHNIDRLLGELQHKKFKRGGDIQEHLSEMTTLRVELRDLQHEVQDVVDLQHEVQDVVYVRMLLNSLPTDPEFEKVKGFVDYGDDNLLSKPDDVIMKIRMAATRQAERHKASKEARGHKSDSVKSDKKEDGDEKKKKYRKKCFNCGSTEHLKRDCQADSGQGKKGSDQKQSNYTRSVLGLRVYGGDINTAYLNARLKIPQYLRRIEGFPSSDGRAYIVRRALYGLRQAGREWNEEINQWLLLHKYQRSTTEPCLYFRMEGENIVIILVYVDDLLYATNNEHLKVQLFKDLSDDYGVKDQGILTDYLGVEVEQSNEKIAIHQGKYTRLILDKYGYADANKVGNPMETNTHLVAASSDEELEKNFDADVSGN
ncbi:hypothetical protein ATCC90586_007837 [Pythium insidiosum]|nr:hypothetical protein ATCC90586_007837 [Pythium insidiosum]